MPDKRKRFTAAGFQIFAGGFTLGVERYFQVLMHLEENNYGVATFRHNRPRIPVYIGHDDFPMDKLDGVDFLYGNPPCAAWSVAGYTKTRGPDKWKTDERVGCTERFFGLLKTVRPKMWVWESVTQAFSKGLSFVMGLTREAAKLGYSVSFLLHDAQWFGLPQVRKRFFMVVHQVAFRPIVPSFKAPPTPLEVLKGAVKGGEPCWGKSGTEKRWTADLIKDIEPGTRIRNHWEALKKGSEDTWERNANGTIKGRPSFGHCRLPLDRPGGAIVGYGLIHPTEHRFISTEEMQVLSGFPCDYHFTPRGSSARMSEIARGVCPPVAAWLARSVLAALERPIGLRKPTVTLYDFRQPGIEPRPMPEALNNRPPILNIPAPPAPKLHVPKLHVPCGAKPNGPRKAPVRPQGIGAFIREELLKGTETGLILKMVYSKFPESRATAADVAWNRGKLRKQGLLCQ
jgi:site-specific DNA-cytosine methylase